MVTVKIYTKEDCHLCEEAKETLLSARKDFLFKFEEVDISSDKSLYEAFKEKIPVIFIEGKIAFKYRVEEKKLRRKLGRLFRKGVPLQD